jgi:hypothetical protein
MADGWGDIALSLMPDLGLKADPELFSPVLSAPSPAGVEAMAPSAVSSSDLFASEVSQPQSRWSGFGDVAKATLPFVQIGTGLAGAAGTIQGIRQMAEQTNIAKSAEQRQAGIAKEAQAAAGPVRAFGEQQLTQAAQGQIDPAIEKQIQLWIQGAKQKAQDFAARSGQGDSQQLVDWLNWIEEMGQAMRAQAIQGEQGLGLQAEGTAANILGVGAGAAGGAGGAAAGQQNSLAQLIAAANQELSRISAGAS